MQNVQHGIPNNKIRPYCPYAVAWQIERERRMGREIRRVPPNWEHPKKEGEDIYQPMYNEYFDDALQAWIEGYELWKSGKHPNQTEDCEYWDWEGRPPDPHYYRHGQRLQDTWYQLYETISEGTPVTPPFETKGELIDYLVNSGTFWNPKGWGREAAEKMVSSGWAPSAVMVINDSGCEFKHPRDGF
jgi:hypothetical protein